MSLQEQAAYGNPFAHTNPALAAAYNAAFAALSSPATNFPDLSQLPPGSVPIALGGQLGPQNYSQRPPPPIHFASHFPTFSVPMPGATFPVAPPNPSVQPPSGSSTQPANTEAGPSTSAASSSEPAATSSAAPTPVSQPFYAPQAFAYVPVSLVRSHRIPCS